nr:nuclease-related domain-containing protein [Clostridium sp. Cult3]
MYILLNREVSNKNEEVILVTIVLIAIILLYFYLDRKKYNKSIYKDESKLSYFQVKFNKGLYGEYLSFRILESLPGYSKILVNTYIPKDDKTTEIDIIFIHQTGIYVIESKNYGGWIFGNENNKNWLQTFKNGHKSYFYNPIWQNNTHIKCLKNLLKDEKDDVYTSIIVFSERCTLKKIETYSDQLYVIKRTELQEVMENILADSRQVISPDRILEIYKILKPYTNVSDELKEKHIENLG